MKNFVSLLLLVCGVVSCTGQGQKKKIAKTPAAAGKSDGNTLLWQVSGNGLEKPSYVYGTMHLLCKEDAKLSAGLKDALLACDKIYMELDMDNMSELMGMVTEMKMKGGKKLKDIVTAEEYQKIKDFFTKEQGMLPFAMMEDMKPLLLASTIMEQGMECKEQGMAGSEMSIMEENKANPKMKKEILGLETMKMQAAVFDSIPYEKQAKELLKYIDSGDVAEDETAKLVAAYKSQNLDSILNLTEKSEPGLTEYMDLLLYQRNRNWITQFKTIFAKQPVVVAVGAAHLVGPGGVLALLKKEGYTLTPVNNR
jgi:uncharacterized protein